MTPEIALKHEFIEFIPDELEPGIVYVSIRFATASHLCVCGCGNKVVTPIGPTDWTLLFDGKTISLEPSIGNWSFPCQSHYYVRKNRVKWAPKWSREQIERGRRYDSHAKHSYFEVGEIKAGADATVHEATKPKRGWWQLIKQRWS
ncbi:MAG: DUF6527 family protein [Acidobacteriaceae bacterium]